MRTVIAGLSFVGLLICCANLPAQNWGTITRASIHDRFAGSSLANNFTTDADGGAGTLFTQSLVDDAVTLDSFGRGPHDRGLAQAFAGLTFGGNLTPSLKARAVLTGNISNQPPVNGVSVNDARARGTANASEIFQYIGAVSNILTLSFTLEGGLVDDLPGNTGTYISSQVAVFGESGYFFTTEITNLLDNGVFPKSFDFTSLQILDDTAGLIATRTANLSFRVDPGEVFYLFEQLDTAADRDARAADAFGTLTAQFDQPELVRSLSVPEPSTFALFAIGLAGLAMANKRMGKRNCHITVSRRIASAHVINARHLKCDHKNQFLVNIAVVCSTVWCAHADAAAPMFMGLGDLPGGGFSSFAYDVSADGSVVVGQGLSAAGAEAFRWTQGGGMIGLGALPSGSFGSIAFGTSADGSVVVGQSEVQFAPPLPTGPLDAFRWTNSGGMEALSYYTYGSTAVDVSADGSVVVGTGTTFPGRGIRPSRPPETEAFRWSQGGGLVRLGDLPGGLLRGSASGVSADGSVVVGYGYSAAGAEAFRWTQGSGMVGLGDLPGGSFSSSASDVSADGSVIVGYSISTGGAEAFRWTQAGGMVGLGILPGFDFSRADDVSADGSIVVGWGYSATSISIEALLWDEAHGMRSLRDVLVNEFGLGTSLDGWKLEYARGISADSRVIVGYGLNPNGDREAWIARRDSAPALPGDYNRDGTVDAADYVVWRKNPGGIYTANDYNIWRAHFGQTVGSGADATANAATPEPKSFVLLVVGMLAMCSCRRTYPIAEIGIGGTSGAILAMQTQHG